MPLLKEETIENEFVEDFENIGQLSQQFIDKIVESSSKSLTRLSIDSGPPREYFTVILWHVGGFGWWQWKLLLITSFCGIFTAFHNLGAVFLAADPDHWCEVPGLNGSYLNDSLVNASIPWYQAKDGEIRRSKCYYVDPQNISQLEPIDPDITQPIVKIKNSTIKGSLNHIVKHNVHSYSHYGILNIKGDHPPLDPLLSNESGLLNSCSSWVYDQSIYASTIVSEWDLVCTNRWLMSTVQASYVAGLLIGALFLSELSDRFGRRTIGLISSIMLLVTSVATAFSTHYIIFISCRFLVALFSSGVYLSNFVNLMESVNNEGRTTMGVLFHVMFTCGFCIMAGLAYLIRDWRYLQLSFSAPVGLLIGYCWILPESPRWLMMKGRSLEAYKILTKIAKANDRFVPDPKTWDNIVTKIKIVSKKRTCCERLENFFQSQITMCKSRNLRNRCLIMFLTWFVAAMIYYGIVFIGDNLHTSTYLLVTLSGLVEIPGYPLLIWTLHKFGRRLNLCFWLISSGLVCLSIVLVPRDMVTVNLALAVTAKFLISPAFKIGFLVTAELVPTPIRTIAVGTASVFGRVGSGIVPYIVDLLGDIHYAIPSIVFGCLALLSGSICLLLPETSHLGLPDSVEEVNALPR